MQEIHKFGLPVRVALGPSSLYVELRGIATEQLRDAFMQETVNRVPAKQAVLEIPKDQVGSAAPSSAPAGLIFHVARCGSTLVSQLLKQHEQVVVYSEPLPVNEVLVPPHKWDRAERVGALRSLGAVFARHARKPYILKLSSWNTLYCDLVAEAFPSTPWALCVRDPVEVCVSLLHQRPGWLRQPSPFFEIVDPDQSSRAPEDQVARLYGAFCRAAAQMDTERATLIPYERLPEAVWNVLGPHFGLSIDRQLRDRMSTAAHAYSKSPVGKTIKFVPDDTKKRAAASPELRRAVEAFARPEFERLAARFC